jgi:8-oxo-dGTP pyrophosphatase MutT (NUDIX family)
MKRFEHNELKRRLAHRLATGQRTTKHIEGYRHSAVLVPLIESGGWYSLLFTKRTDEVETHKGQISFPGGVVDENDKGPVDTALREAFEEVGIPPTCVEPLGLLDDITTPFGFVITPVVCIVSDLPRLVPNPVEVAEVFQVPLLFFSEPGNGRMEYREVGGHRHEVWFYDTGAHVIWGATATIVRLLLDRLTP